MTPPPFRSPLPAHGLRAWAVVDLAALARNLAAVRAALPAGLRLISVVKANAYGHGVEPVARAALAAGADRLAVANVTEGAELRAFGVTVPILVMSSLVAEDDPALIEHGLTATLSDAAEVERWVALARRTGQRVTVHLKVDTGMGRAGVWHEQAAALAQVALRAGELRMEGIYTHLASADADPEFTHLQRQRLATVLAQLPNLDRQALWIHADNSAGIESFDPAVGCNAVRIGLIQFGVRPTPGSLLAGLEVEPVLGFHTRIGLIKELPAGTGIGYGSTHRLAAASRIGVLTAGYADGIPRSLGNRGAVLVHGRRCPIVGRVSMDQTVVDLSGVPQAAPGDTATLIGRQHEATIDATEFSQWADSIAWETFCRLSPRTVRVYP